MGAGLSEEDDGGQEAGPPCNERYLHWLLSDPARVQEAFKAVWRACSTDEQGTAPKPAVLEVMLRVVSEFERTAELDADTDSADAAGKTARQLSRVVSMLPDQLTRSEALHLFRTALLSVQASLVVASWQQGRQFDINWPPSAGSASVDPSQMGQSPSPSMASGGSRLGMGASVPGSRHHRRDARDLTALLRMSTRAEDPITKLRVMRLHPAVKGAQLHPPGSLPSREELEDENKLLIELSRIVEASTREELVVVRALEEEITASEAAGEQSRPSTRSFGTTNRGGASAGSDDALFGALEAKARATEEEVAQLEARVKSRDSELAGREAEVAEQQREIHSLSTKRWEEEASVDELNREVRELTLELKSSRRTCGSLESEIASEEARAAALRQAFEGRRQRFTTAETAARNAELSTMRATRRRAAAEAAARRESSAVEEAETARIMTSTSAAGKIEALTAQLEEVRNTVGQLVESGGTRRAPPTLHVTLGAEDAVTALRMELREASHECDKEVELAMVSANEVAELEASHARLEGQLATRESELHAVARRAIRNRSPSVVTAGAPVQRGGEDEREVGSMSVALQAAEQRTASLKQRELELHAEFRSLVGLSGGQQSGGQHDPEQDQIADAAWRHAREIGAELGEAHAALARRQAQDHSGGDVISALQRTLQAAEEQEAARCGDLAEACRRLASTLTEQQRLRTRAQSVEKEAGGTTNLKASRLLQPTRGRQQGSAVPMRGVDADLGPERGGSGELSAIDVRVAEALEFAQPRSAIGGSAGGLGAELGNKVDPARRFDVLGKQQGASLLGRQP